MRRHLSLRCLLLPVLSLESFDSPRRIDEFLLAGEEGMALGTDLQVDLWLCRARMEGFTARTGDNSFYVLWMDTLFHQTSVCHQRLR